MCACVLVVCVRVYWLCVCVLVVCACVFVVCVCVLAVCACVLAVCVCVCVCVCQHSGDIFIDLGSLIVICVERRWPGLTRRCFLECECVSVSI